MIKRYISRVAAWVSQGVNCIILAGHHDMTVSARCYINRKKKGWGKAYSLINTAFFWQENHCKESFMRDVEFAREVKSILKGG